MGAAYEPQTLQEAIVYFADPDNCLKYLVGKRWPDGVVCPTCGGRDVIFLANQRRWKCRQVHDRRQFSVKVGTIFEDSPLDLYKWLTAMWQIVNCKNGISSYEVHRAIGITQKSAWFMNHRIRYALGLSSIDKLSDEVETDKTFIGGKASNMHKGKRERVITGTGSKDKTVVMGILERGGKIRTTVVPNLAEAKGQHFTIEGKGKRVARSLAAVNKPPYIRLTPNEWRQIVEDPDLEDQFS
jgi:transposase-like zinc ribbon protein/ISXO2 transposase-like protein